MFKACTTCVIKKSVEDEIVTLTTVRGLQQFSAAPSSQGILASCLLCFTVFHNWLYNATQMWERLVISRFSHSGWATFLFYLMVVLVSFTSYVSCVLVFSFRSPTVPPPFRSEQVVRWHSIIFELIWAYSVYKYSTSNKIYDFANATELDGIKSKGTILLDSAFSSPDRHWLDFTRSNSDRFSLGDQGLRVSSLWRCHRVTLMWRVRHT